MIKALVDFRGKLTVETGCVLRAEIEAHGGTEQEIVRLVMHEWAIKRIKAVSVLSRHLIAEGLAGESKGSRGRTGD